MLDISLSLAYSECNLFVYNCRTIVTKPRVLAHMIRNKFGSADNISSMRKLYFCYLNKQVNSRGSFLHQAPLFRVNWTGSYHDHRLETVHPSSVVLDLVVWLDYKLSSKQHVSKIAGICHYQLHRICLVGIGGEVAIHLFLALIMSKLDYCNAILTEHSTMHAERISL